ncbi:hypothetical protein CLV78_102545 [Aliiruegeria haliotis]|uniref:Uncharacterized protein n=2 Tax=Aliiruegeria haliotis TaxID=1280846 RepID=A0A2T0RW37_9RHOB|nr:hypothetical protein CLV78_102545 [Aliiruegeria haliotis]
MSGWRGLTMSFVAVLLVLAPFYVDFNSQDRLETWVRWYGMILQLIGFGMAFWGVEGSLKQLGVPTIRHRMSSYATGFLSALRVKNVTANPKAGKAQGGGFRAGSKVTPGPDATLKHRIELLEGALSSLQDEVDGLTSSTNSQFSEMARELKNVDRCAERRTLDEKKRVSDLLVGNASLEAAGILLFFLGVVFATASPEIAKALM